jgi:hypothetical protein
MFMQTDAEMWKQTHRELNYYYDYYYYYGSTAICWVLADFQFLDPIRSRQDSLVGGSARRKAATYIQNDTNTE